MRILGYLLALVAIWGSVMGPVAASPTVAPGSAHLVKALKITVLSTMLADGDELGEWGYAALVEVDDRKILFDAGLHPDVVLKNARSLGVDLSQVEEVVISHNHRDHVGGLLVLRRALSERNPHALSRVHVGAGIFTSRRGRDGKEGNGILPLKADYEGTGGRFIIHNVPVELAPGVWFTGPVPRTHQETNWTPGLMLRTEAGLAPDNMHEDSSLVFSTRQGMVVLTGCGHAGVVNIVEYAEAITGEKQVLALIGGIHLFAKKNDVIEWTAAKLQRFRPRNLLMGHCTGIEATYRLRELLSLDRSTAVVSAVGSSFDLNEGINPRAIAA